MGSIITESNQGGGLHGRITVEMKQAFFDEVKGYLKSRGYKEEAGELQYRDLITLAGGTSFGGLSAIAMSGINGVNGGNPYFTEPRELGDFIDQEAGNIFPNRGFWEQLVKDPQRAFAGVIGKPRYSNKSLVRLVKGIVGEDSRMSDIQDDVMVTMTRFHPTVDTIFAKSHIARGEGSLLEAPSEAGRKDWLIWEAAVGGASATSYLPAMTLHNPNRAERFVVVDGGQSGWNNPSIPVHFETTFVYGQSGCGPEGCMSFDFNDAGLLNGRVYVPHDVVHIHWGTGEFSKGLSYEEAMENTVYSTRKLVGTSAILGVNRFSQAVGSSGVSSYFNFDVNIDSFDKAVRPDADFTNSSKKQLLLLRDVGLAAADRLSRQIQSAASLVANAYIERIKFERSAANQTYKDFLKDSAPEV